MLRTIEPGTKVCAKVINHCQADDWRTVAGRLTTRAVVSDRPDSRGALLASVKIDLGGTSGLGTHFSAEDIIEITEVF